MKIMIGNTTSHDFWVTLTASMRMSEDGPEPHLTLFVTEAPARPETVRNGQLLFSERIESGGILRRDGIPDTDRRPTMRGRGDFGGLAARIMTRLDDGVRHLLITIRSDDPEEVPESADPPMPDPSLPVAITVKNALAKRAYLTFFVAPIDAGDESFLEGLLAGDPPLMLMLMVTEKRPRRSVMAGAHILRQRSLEPGKEFTLTDLPPVDSMGVAPEERFCDTNASEETSDLGTTLVVEIVPPSPE